MSEKDKIFERIREALKSPAPFPGHHHGHSDTQAVGDARQWLPWGGATLDDRLALFHKNAEDLKARFCLLEHLDGVSKALLELSRAEGWKRIATHSGALTDAASTALGLPVLRADQAYDATELERCDAGITECDALVAQTGSVLLTSRSAGGRALSVLPPHHVVLARRGQLLPDLSAAFDLLKTKYGANYPSFITFITGPSRTGDIERVLVLGAHGPKKLSIFCV